jgi:hypothetical protein
MGIHTRQLLPGVRLCLYPPNHYPHHGPVQAGLNRHLLARSPSLLTGDLPGPAIHRRLKFDAGHRYTSLQRCGCSARSTAIVCGSCADWACLWHTRHNHVKSSALAIPDSAPRPPATGTYGHRSCDGLVTCGTPTTSTTTATTEYSAQPCHRRHRVKHSRDPQHQLPAQLDQMM